MLLLENLLFYILMFPIAGILLLMFVPSNKKKLLKVIALNSSCLSFISSLILWGFFQKSTGSFQFVIKLFWLPSLNLNFTLGVDGVSLFFILLTTLLIPLCLLTSWNSVNINLKEFLIAFLFLNFFLIGTFCILDLLLFYIFFESVLVPMERMLGFLEILQGCVYRCIVISLIKDKSLFNYGVCGKFCLINGFTFLSTKGLFWFLKSSIKRLSLAHCVWIRSIPFKNAKGSMWMFHFNHVYRIAFCNRRSKSCYVISYRSFSTNYKSDVILVDERQKKLSFAASEQKFLLAPTICEVRQTYIKKEANFLFKLFKKKIHRASKKIQDIFTVDNIYYTFVHLEIALCVSFSSCAKCCI